MKSNNKQRLFEMMNKVTGMPLNETELSYGTDYDTPYDNKDKPNNPNKLTLYLDYSRSLIISDGTDTTYEFEPYNDGTIDTDFETMRNDLRSYFGNGRRKNVEVSIKINDYNGNHDVDEFSDIINTFEELVRFINECNAEFGG